MTYMHILSNRKNIANSQEVMALSARALLFAVPAQV